MSGALSFPKKLLRVSITLANGATLSNGANTQVLENLRMSCEIKKTDSETKRNTCRVRIYGLSQDLANTLTVIPNQPKGQEFPAATQVYLQVEAGDENGFSVAFQGEIASAVTRYSSPPNNYFEIASETAHYLVRLPATPRSYKGSVNVEDIISDLAATMGMTFYNRGFHATLQNVYLTGSSFSMLQKLNEMVHMECHVDDGKICIAPKGKPCNVLMNIPLISAQTGMKSSPVFDRYGAKVDTLYNPAIQMGGQVAIKSDAVDDANSDQWIVHEIHSHLECLNPHGHWFSTISVKKIAGP